jgi:SWIM/SEC-C metal-binding protein
MDCLGPALGVAGQEGSEGRGRPDVAADQTELTPLPLFGWLFPERKTMASLGTKKHPAVVRVGTVEQAEEIVAFCRTRGWQVIVGVEPDKPEDLSDLEELIRDSEKATSAASHPPRTSRNDPCPCGSGRKFKRCCGAR